MSGELIPGGIASARHEITELLVDHGQYFALAGDRKNTAAFTMKDGREQRFGLPELGPLALALLLWALSEYSRAFLAERGKHDAKRLFDRSDRKSETDMANEIRQLVLVIRDSGGNTDEETSALKPSDAEVVEALREMGLTRKRAERAAVQLARELRNQVGILIVSVNEKDKQ